jgi:hypothetical protein
MEIKRMLSWAMRHRVAWAFGLLALLASCAPTHNVRPLQKGEVIATASLGGSAFTNFGFPLPAPNTTVGAGYGITDKISGYVSFYPTAAAFGVMQFDVAAVYGFLKPNRWKPGVSASPALNLAGSVWDSKFKIWPQLDANAYWEYGAHRNIIYAGISSWFELANKRAHGQPQPQWLLPGFQIGHTVSGKVWDFTTELKMNNFTKSNQDLTVSWVSFGKSGALGIYFGINRHFGK